MDKKILIGGMSCKNCVAHVKEALEELEGVSSVEVNLEEEYARVETTLDYHALKEAVEEAGYEVKGIE